MFSNPEFPWDSFVTNVPWFHLSLWTGLHWPPSPIAGHFCMCRSQRPWLLNSLHSTSSCDSKWVKVIQLCPTVCGLMDYTVHGILQPEYWSGSLSLLQGIFPTQGSNQGLLLCRWILYQLSHKGSPCDSNQGVYCQSLNSGSSAEPRKTHVFVLCFWKLGNMEALWGWGNIHWVDCRHCSILKSSSDHEGEVSALVELMFSRWVQMGSLPCHQGALCPWISSLLHEVMVSSSPKKVRPLKDFVLNSNISLCSSFSLIQTARIWSLWKRPKLDKSKCVHVEGSYKVT